MGGKELLQKSATECTLSTALGVGAGGSSDSASAPAPAPALQLPPCPRGQASVGSERALGGLLYFLAPCSPLTLLCPLSLQSVPLAWLPPGFPGTPAAFERSSVSRRQRAERPRPSPPLPLPSPPHPLRSFQAFCCLLPHPHAPPLAPKRHLVAESHSVYSPGSSSWCLPMAAPESLSNGPVKGQAQQEGRMLSRPPSARCCSAASPVKRRGRKKGGGEREFAAVREGFS